MRILWECFPLAVSMCLNMYIANAPKYTIDASVPDDTQTAFNVVFMPVFVIALMANFVYQPVLKGIGELWNSGNRDGFRRKIRKLALGTVALDAALVGIGTLVGIPFLELVYGIELASYKKILALFLVAGGVIALQNLMILVITAQRMQRFMIFGYVATAAVYFVTDTRILNRGWLKGLVTWYLLLMTGLLIYSFILYLMGLRKAEV